MKRFYNFLLLKIPLVALFCSFTNILSEQLKRDVFGYVQIDSLHDVYCFYPRSVEELKQRSDYAQKEALLCIEKIKCCPLKKQNKETMLRMFDQMVGLISPVLNGAFLMMVLGDNHFNKEAQKIYEKLGAFWLESVEGSGELYKAFHEYAEGNAKREKLSDQDRYLLADILKKAQRTGASLCSQDCKKIASLKERTASLVSQFCKIIDTDPKEITFLKSELVGLPEEKIEKLSHTGAVYRVPLSYSVYSDILCNCSLESTRKKYYQAFYNIAYPANVSIFKELAACRNEIASLLGFSSYADYELENAMCQNSKKVISFEKELLPHELKKAEKNHRSLLENLPSDVFLRSDGLLDEWNTFYVQAQNFKSIKKENEKEDSFFDYFPLEKTLEGMITVFEKFFDVSIKKLPVKGLWHKDVQLLQIADKNQKYVRGYVFLDLFARKNKFDYFALFFGTPAFKKASGLYSPCIVTLLANIGSPAPYHLLNEYQYRVLFHEFGHAIHSALGATEYVVHSGPAYNVQTGLAAIQDFVEIPGRVCEYLAKDRDVLKMVSSHYLTGKPLSDKMIDQQFCDRSVNREIFYDLVDIGACSSEGSIEEITKKYHELCLPFTSYYLQNHHYCSSRYIAVYGPFRYAYLWSNVIAADIFKTLKSKGLFSKRGSKKYKEAILAGGSSKNPNKMVRDFLGREPKKDAFYKLGAL